MPFLTSQQILERLPTLVKDAKQDRVTAACYELGLGDEACITPVGEGRRTFKDNRQIVIPPGQFGILVTEEEVTIPNDMLAFISIKSKKKMVGLVNVSGFHVDPGFTGKLKFSVYNAGAGDIFLDVGKPLFLIWFAQLSDADLKARTGAAQLGILDEDVSRLRGDVTSLGSLKAEIEGLRKEFWYWRAVALTIILTALAIWVREGLTKKEDPPKAAVPTVATPSPQTWSGQPTPAPSAVSPVTAPSPQTLSGQPTPAPSAVLPVTAPSPPTGSGQPTPAP